MSTTIPNGSSTTASVSRSLGEQAYGIFCEDMARDISQSNATLREENAKLELFQNKLIMMTFKYNKTMRESEEDDEEDDEDDDDTSTGRIDIRSFRAEDEFCYWYDIRGTTPLVTFKNDRLGQHITCKINDVQMENDRRLLLESRYSMSEDAQEPAVIYAHHNIAPGVVWNGRLIDHGLRDVREFIIDDGGGNNAANGGTTTKGGGGGPPQYRFLRLQESDLEHGAFVLETIQISKFLLENSISAMLIGENADVIKNASPEVARSARTILATTTTGREEGYSGLLTWYETKGIESTFRFHEELTRAWEENKLLLRMNMSCTMSKRIYESIKIHFANTRLQQQQQQQQMDNNMVVPFRATELLLSQGELYRVMFHVNRPIPTPAWQLRVTSAMDKDTMWTPVPLNHIGATYITLSNIPLCSFHDLLSLNGTATVPIVTSEQGFVILFERRHIIVEAMFFFDETADKYINQLGGDDFSQCLRRTMMAEGVGGGGTTTRMDDMTVRFGLLHLSLDGLIKERLDVLGIKLL